MNVSMPVRFIDISNVVLGFVVREAVQLAIGSGLSKKDAAAEVAELFSVARNRVYEIAIAL